jgi:hypothetical protein
MTENPQDGAALTAPAAVPDALKRRPIIDLLDEEQVKLIAARAQAGSDATISRGELAAFLELAASYQLDPFSGEVWLAKSKRGRVLIMVGRDGLRKIAQRNGLYVDGDVIHEADTFKVERTLGGARAVSHTYGHPKERGPIVGAWCEVRGPSRTVREGLASRRVPGAVVGFFVATAEEYKPKSADALKYSPWGSQESVMMLAAAERQALRQATPLSGLVAQGELDRVNEEPVGEAPAFEMGLDELRDTLLERGGDPDYVPSVVATVRRAQKLGHAGHGNAATVAMLLGGRPLEAVRAWLAEVNYELDGLVGNPDDVPDAVVVVVDGDDGEPVPGPEELDAEQDAYIAANLEPQEDTAPEEQAALKGME